MEAEKRNVLIIDSDEEKTKMLTGLLRRVHNNLNIYAVSNGTEAYECMMRTTMDVFILDVVLGADQYGENSGLRLVEHIREITRYLFTPVVFVTAVKGSELYAYQRLHCMGYVKKPYNVRELEEIFSYVLRFRTKRNDERTLVFRNRSIIYPVKISEIVFVESIKHQMYIHLSDGNVFQIPYRTCKKFLEEADTDCLIQCSRNTLFNRKYMLGINVADCSVVMRNRLGRLQIGSTYKEIVLRRLGIEK